MKQIAQALEVADDEDLDAIRQYVEWVRIRSEIYRYFYFSAHWVKPFPMQYHWLE